MGLLLKISDNRRVVKAFTMLEVVLAISIAITTIFLGRKFIAIVGDNSQQLAEYRSIDKELRAFATQMSDDLESIVLLNKHQPLLEVTSDDNRENVKIFFFTTAEKNITTAVAYHVNKISTGRFTASRTTLDHESSLKLQSMLHKHSSLERQFESWDSAKKQTKTFSVQLSDFRIRAAITRYTRSLIFSPANTKMIYVDGVLHYESRDNVFKIPGEISFFDITARAFTKNDSIKFSKTKFKNPQEAKDFIFANSRKCFYRITPNSENF